MISALEDTDGYSAIVVVISAHGNENGLVVNHPDNVFMKTSSLDTQKIFEILEMKTDLVGKPKIVVLDAYSREYKVVYPLKADYYILHATTEGTIADTNRLSR